MRRPSRCRFSSLFHWCAAGLPWVALGCAQQVPSLAEHGSVLPPAPVARGAAPEAPETLPAPRAARAVPIGLDTVLRLAEVQNSQVALARERVREAYADKELAQLAWLPALQVGTAYYRHEGGIQNEDGTLVRSSTGALFGGLDFYGRLDLREAIFERVNAERKLWQQKGELSRITSEVLLEAATTYIDLLAARHGEAIVTRLLKSEEDVLDEARKIAKVEPGTEFQVKAIEAEVHGLRALHTKLRQQGNAAAKKLGYLLGVGPDVQLVPVDGYLVAFELVDPTRPVEELVNQALTTGPGVRELERLLAVIHQAQEQAKGPGRFLPVIEMRMLEGGFGAAPGARLDWANRWDLGLQARWNLTDLCKAGAAQRAADARLSQMHLTYQDTRARLTLGVEEAREASLSGREEVKRAGEAVEHASKGYQLSHKRLKDNVPGSTTTEVLQFIRSLQIAYLNYLAAISAYDKAQLRLMVLTGAVTAKDGAACHP